MEPRRTPRPGDPCPFDDCAGVLQTYSTHINFALQKRFRYYHCPVCNREQTRGKWTVPLEYAPPRTSGSNQGD